jgi:hypothetical protein
MLLGAVRFFLDHGADATLLNLYPRSFGQYPGIDAYPRFREFVLTSREPIIEILRSRSVQSNVVRRCAVLVLGLLRISQILEAQPFANIEIGASLGLTLLWRHFSYDYGDGLQLSPKDSAGLIRSRLTGPAPFGDSAAPETISDTGIELFPVNLDDAESIAWLEALIWPEHDDNRTLWRLAVSLARRNPPRVVGGDANEVLPQLIAELLPGIPVCIYHSHTLNQFGTDAKARFQRLLRDESGNRRLFRISFESDGGHSALRLFEYLSGDCRGESHLADCEPHARWIRWHGR